MNFVVCVKQTPDTAEMSKISVAEVSSGDIKATLVLNPWDEYAVEEALLLQDRFGGEVTVMTTGPETATDALKDAIARGIKNALLLDDPAFSGTDAWGTAAILSAAIRKNGDFDVVLTGKMSVDGNSGLVAPGLARKLGATLLTQVTRILDIADGMITVERQLEEGREIVTATLPAVVSVGKEINEPRYPSFMGIRKAARADIPVWSAQDLASIDPLIGTNGYVPGARWTDLRKPPARASEVVLVDEGSVDASAAKLADLLMAEKVV
ncbi:MAG: electron transfer flavoprotein subunit beta/FixA family protein [Chloroflexota bacterium]|nr:electron transfer flavoprotein subunit beta/FixA family protein [Chloroflexota bacterium]